ncbi:hypothetical protein AQS8620_01882 [Aquimixticola soesokkakensis]|uniref:Uncharacterized protein n=1 Tax=Aquimixticola soesokkakensis TaxID=1519096 RepID=A0A1Y5SQL8_9RHOB|nr:hypothetical protein [Aquimixticola soesokkakensis]SLN45928.1 hypothetical protein AQS8620_01882 [Aquimixticola soesokkakensis]
MINVAIVVSLVAVAGLLVWPRVANAPLWRATVTPLASIIGSGFLVLGPILDVSFGIWTPLAMAALCAVAYAFGWAVRHNIAAEARGSAGPKDRLEQGANLVLAFAYFISVAYYLNLFGAFAVSLTPFDTEFVARMVTTGVFVIILVVGFTKGFRALERMEQVSVGIKLAIIAGLIVGLAWHFGGEASGGRLVFNAPSVGGWQAVTLLFGLIVTVQGFETSRYLGATYDAATRVRSMRLAQWISTAIYMAYIVLIAYSFRPDQLSLEETAIIDMMSVVAPVLPALLVAAALAAQFSAAVADTSGAGGLVREVSGGKVPAKFAYVLLVAVGLLLTWGFDVYQIISYASRAFAAYYALQALIAAVLARKEGGWKVWAFGALALLGVAITVLGRAVEGG